MLKNDHGGGSQISSGEVKNVHGEDLPNSLVLGETENLCIFCEDVKGVLL